MIYNTFVGIVWVLVTFYGPASIDGVVYISQTNCEAALTKIERSESCNPAPGGSCTSGPHPLRKCMAMEFAPDQSVPALK